MEEQINMQKVVEILKKCQSAGIVINIEYPAYYEFNEAIEFLENEMKYPTRDKDLTTMANYLRDWSEAVKDDASWDGWGHYYKDVYYNDTEIAGLVKFYSTPKE